MVFTVLERYVKDAIKMVQTMGNDIDQFENKDIDYDPHPQITLNSKFDAILECKGKNVSKDSGVKEIEK